MKKKQRAEFEAPLVGAIATQAEGAFSLLTNGPTALMPPTQSASTPTGPPSPKSGAPPKKSPTARTFYTGKPPSPASGTAGRTTIQSAASTPSSATRLDRIKLQEVEWFATRSPELALAPTAAARRRGIKQLRDEGDPLAAEFDDAKLRADRLGQLIRASNHYPLLGGGDINLYSLFVERAMRMVKPDGIVGLLTPSGIYADKTAARFFKSVSTSGRVGGLFDFENRRLGTDLPPFFPDVDSRFKFCALIFGGEERSFAQTDCAFFLHDTAAVDDPDRCFPWLPPTSPASIPTPAPPPSSAPAATPTSPAASTNATLSSLTVAVARKSVPGRFGTIACST